MKRFGLALFWTVFAFGQQPAAAPADPKDLAVLEGRVPGSDGGPLR